MPPPSGVLSDVATGEMEPSVRRILKALILAWIGKKLFNRMRDDDDAPRRRSGRKSRVA
jgi:hypothetical protein